ncbi:MAG: hypothetical protein WAO55_12305, partial [Candidatus Manganitrophaceae bacterium]
MEKKCSFRGLLLGLLLGLGALPGCGGGGGGGAPSPPQTAPLTGRFMDAPVAGLHYSTPTGAGETSADGEFLYQPGETVRFSVGDIVIGEVAGAPVISPFDLAGMTPPQTGNDTRRAANRGFSLKQATPLEIAANIALFLQTLDEDGDPNNGIKIPAAMHTLAAGTSLNFKRKWSVFPSDLSFRNLVAAGRAAGLWGGSRAVRKTAYVLDSLYAGLGLTPTIEAVSVIDEDGIAGFIDADGIVDSRETRAYDANGNLTLFERDFTADGTVDFRQTRVYDANGNLTLWERDDNADGTVDSRETRVYDANGNLTLHERDFNANGTVDSRHNSVYDANGNLTLFEQDDNADGTVDSRETRVYDANGNLTL